nr:unnamed protein product [Spirometra erinaceieuropaei]
MEDSPETRMIEHAAAVRRNDASSQVATHWTRSEYTFKFDEAEILARGDNRVSRDLSANPICDLPAERGGCLGVQLSVYYDSKEGKCKPFIYSGCGGNENNFMSNADCMKACGGGRS